MYLATIPSNYPSHIIEMASRGPLQTIENLLRYNWEMLVILHDWKRTRDLINSCEPLFHATKSQLLFIDGLLLGWHDLFTLTGNDGRLVIGLDLDQLQHELKMYCMHMGAASDGWDRLQAIDSGRAESAIVDIRRQMFCENQQGH